MCLELLGEIPSADYLEGLRLKIIWLERTFTILPQNPSIRDIECATRAYILRLIGGMLMPDKSSNRVHLMYF